MTAYRETYPVEHLRGIALKLTDLAGIVEDKLRDTDGEEFLQWKNVGELLMDLVEEVVGDARARMDELMSGGAALHEN